MTDTSDDRPDPVLVRPYVKPLPDKPARDPADAPTVIQPVIADDTAPLPAVPGPAPRRPLGLRPLGLRLLALVVGTALALAVAGWLIFHPARDTTQPGAALPQFRATLPADPGAAPASHRAGASASASPSASASTSASVSASVPASASASAPVSPSSPATPAPPASDRTGTIKAASGRCLALGGLLGLDGSPVQVAGCADRPAQKFTLAADGTLQVSGRCATATADGTVRIAGCGDADSGQWRSGPSGALVNAAAGRCLVDPGQTGATTRVAACTGSSDQSWTLP
jgi:hypothetical protein